MSIVENIWNILKQKLFKETLWSFLSKGTTFVLFFGLQIILARTLGVEDFGTWSYFLSFMTIVLTLSYFGLNGAVGKFLAEHNKTPKLRAVVRDAFKLRFLLSLGFVLLFAVIAWPLSRSIDRPDFFYFFLISLPFIFLSGFVEFLKDVFIGLHRTKYNFYIAVSEYLSKLLLLCLLFFYQINIVTVIIVYTVALLFTSIIGTIFVYRNFFRGLKRSSERFMKPLLHYSFPLFFVSIGFLLMTEIDTVMIGLLTTDTEVGRYAVAKQIVNKLPHIAVAIAMGTMPIFAKLQKKNSEKLQKLFTRLLTINGAIFGTLMVGIFILSPIFIPLLFGQEYSQSVSILNILSFYMVFSSFSVFFSKFLDYQGLANKRAINLTATIFLNIALNLYFIPRYGAIGAAISTSASYIPYLTLNIAEVIAVFKMKKSS